MTRFEELKWLLAKTPNATLHRKHGGRWVLHDIHGFNYPALWWGPATIKRAIFAGLVKGPRLGPLTKVKQ